MSVLSSETNNEYEWFNKDKWNNHTDIELVILEYQSWRYWYR